jgi:hypothetical protein
MISAHFLEIQCFVHKIQLSNWKSFFAYQECFTFSLKCVFFFWFSLLEVALTNTILASIPIVEKYMKHKYYENSLKDRGYDATGTTLKKVGVLTSGAIVSYLSSFIADVEKFKIGATEYTKNYKEYVLVCHGKNRQPPQPLLTMEVTETVRKVVDLSIKK